MTYQTFSTLLIILFTIQLVSGQNNEIKLDRYLAKRMDKAQVVGMQVGYLKSDGTIWTGSYGKIEHNSKLIVKSNLPVGRIKNIATCIARVPSNTKRKRNDLNVSIIKWTIS